MAKAKEVEQQIENMSLAEFLGYDGEVESEDFKVGDILRIELADHTEESGEYEAYLVKRGDELMDGSVAGCLIPTEFEVVGDYPSWQKREDDLAEKREKHRIRKEKKTKQEVVEVESEAEESVEATEGKLPGFIEKQRAAAKALEAKEGDTKTAKKPTTKSDKKAVKVEAKSAETAPKGKKVVKVAGSAEVTKDDTETSTKSSTKVVKARSTQSDKKETTNQQMVAPETDAIMNAVNSADLHEAALDLARAASDNQITLGAVLSRIYKEGTFKQHIEDAGGTNDNKFEAYLKDHFDQYIEYRKAMFLRQAYEFLTDKGLDLNLITELGYSKVVVLCRLKDQSIEVIEDFAEKARSKNREDLRKEVTDLLETEEEDVEVDASRKEKRKVYKFKLFPDQEAFVTEALNAVMKVNGMDQGQENEALVAMADDWLSMNAAEHVTDVDQAIRNLEARYGVKVKLQDTSEEVDAPIDEASEEVEA